MISALQMGTGDSPPEPQLQERAPADAAPCALRTRITALGALCREEPVPRSKPCVLGRFWSLLSRYSPRSPIGLSPSYRYLRSPTRSLFPVNPVRWQHQRELVVMNVTVLRLHSWPPWEVAPGLFCGDSAGNGDRPHCPGSERGAVSQLFTCDRRGVPAPSRGNSPLVCVP